MGSILNLLMERSLALVFLLLLPALLGLTSGLRRVRSESSEEKCGETEECVAQENCSQFQTKRRQLNAISDKSSQEYSDLLKELKQKICNQAAKKVCCSCPCRSRAQCSPVEDLYQINDIPKLKSLICSRKERTFYCCDNPRETAPAQVSNSLRETAPAQVSNPPRETAPAQVSNPQRETAPTEVSVNPDDPASDPSWLPDPENEDCGLNDSPPSRVVGGVDSEPGEYPYTALIGSLSNGEILWKCGGTLINHWYVLTAAHCQGSGPKRITRVRLGDWSVKDEVDCLTTKKCKRNGDCFCLDPVQDFDIGPNQVIVHENWEAKGQFLNDIALVKLDRAVEQRLGVKFACLPSDLGLAAEHLNVRDLDTNSGLAGKYGIVVGWGYTEYDPWGGVQGDFKEAKVANNIQQKLEIPILTTEECSRKFRGGGFTPAESQICAGGERGKDSCKGDSGGPLYFKHIAGTGNKPAKSSIDPTYLLGIVSFGARDCGNGTPGIYTNVKDFIPWIKKIIKR